MAETNTCPKCGAELRASAPAGICPQCLLKAGLGGSEAAASGRQSAGATSSTPGFVPPTPEELAIAVDNERRRLLGMEGTERLEVPAGLLQGQVARDNVDNVGGIFDLRQHVLRD